MHYTYVKVILLAAGAAQLTNAHTAFTNFFVDGVDQGDGTAVRMSNDIPNATFPISSATSPDMACGVNGETGVSRIAGAKAGSTLTFEWRDWPDGSQPGSIDISHKGPCAVYMKNVEDSSASNNAAGDGWFKIMEDGYDSSAGKWCTEKLIPDDGHLAASIPSDLAAGYYLVRPELLALHQADKTPPDPQFYVGCAQIFLSSSGSATPQDTVSIPGYVNMSTPAMTFNIWQVPMKLPFPDFGPPLYTASTSKRDLEVRTVTQTIGLKPEGCVMENVNWCGFLPPTYSDQNGCWAASQNCSVQATDCYNSAGPTGSKNCFNWEAFCTDIRNGCGSGNYQGPPSIAGHMPAALPTLSANVVAATGPMESSGPGATGSSAPASMGSYAPAGNSTPVLFSLVPAGYNGSNVNGSISACGSNGGQTCNAGMCCSAHG
ncbi:hypothetical protein MMC28_007523 [Mycoblastus sanguinarius]|nr:hypothetical protein [Mycoblastus sanguinarius]